MRGTRTAVLALVLLCAHPCAAQEAERILDGMERVFGCPEDYTVVLDVVADLERVNVPPMEVRMYYKKPDRVHFDSEGFALLPREGAAFNPARFRKLYAVEAAGRDTLRGRTVHRLTLRPRADANRMRRITLYVDPARLTPERLVTVAIDGRTMLADFEFAQAGGCWLPAAVVLTLRADADEPPAADPQAPPEQAAPARPTFRSGTLTIRYRDYRVNTGLNDSLFERKGLE